MTRKILIAAGLLCLGTSPAFAFTLPPMAPDMTKAVKQVWAEQLAVEQPNAFDTGEAWMGPTEPRDSAKSLFEKASFDLSAKTDDSFAKAGPTEPLLKPVDMPARSDATLAGELGGKTIDPVETAAAPDEAKFTAMGGPLEEVDYPPCSRTVTDRCIQLYERGVHR